MTTVPDRILKWLYNCLRSEYHDPNRAYSDVAQTLSQYSSFAPRTEVYTFENGTSALLLLLEGTLPVSFRGTTYRFPIAIWVPHNYPRESPIFYVTPAQDMRVRPGQHVSQEGKVYHPYLAGWANHWRVSNIIDFLTVLSDVFAKEPPVISTQQQQQLQGAARTQPAAGTPPPRPPQPEELRRRSYPSQSSPSSSSQPPARPPKPSEAHNEKASTANTSAQAGPPLPPKPGTTDIEPISRTRNGHATLPGQHATPRSPLSRGYDSRDGPPLPPLPREAKAPPISQQFNPSGHLTQSRNDIVQNVREHDLMPSALQHTQPPSQTYQSYNVTQQPYMQPQSQSTSVAQSSDKAQHQPHHQPLTNTRKQHEPIPDLLTSSFDIPFPTNSTPAAPPPIPPNPEKDALLHVISTSLVNQLQQTLSQNAAAHTALDAQQHAMLQALQNVQAEQGQLSQVSELLSSNEGILRESIREADRVMERVKTREQPGVDEVLVAPTIVAEQLYNLVADERAIEDAMFALTKAVGTGRIGGDVFVKQTRTLAREQFLKKALIKKIAKGMGLDVDASTSSSGTFYQS